MDRQAPAPGRARRVHPDAATGSQNRSPDAARALLLRFIHGEQRLLAPAGGRYRIHGEPFAGTGPRPLELQSDIELATSHVQAIVVLVLRLFDMQFRSWQVYDPPSRLSDARNTVDDDTAWGVIVDRDGVLLAADRYAYRITATRRLFDLDTDETIRHIELTRQISALVVAPATANVLAKMALGLADDLLSCTALATCAPLVVAPAMNENMWRNPINQRNVRDGPDRAQTQCCHGVSAVCQLSITFGV